MTPREKGDSTAAPSSRDWAARNASWMLGWGLPAITLAVGAFTDTEMWIWAPMLTWMGVACLVNARRCGRVHCHFTGPFFLVMALASLLFSLGVLPLGSEGWAWLGGALALGWLSLRSVPEHLWGRYRGTSQVVQMGSHDHQNRLSP
jgi:hypothetical protein